MQIREAWLIAQRSENISLKPDHLALTSQLLSVSSLARNIRDIFYSLRESGLVRVTFNK